MQVTDISAKYEKAVTLISFPADLVELFSRFKRRKKEHFFVATLRADNKVIGLHVVALGSDDKTMVCPRSVFGVALLDGAVKIAVGHNHPTGNPDPSEPDKHITRKLREAGEILDISVIDHIIVCPDGSYYSFEENR